MRNVVTTDPGGYPSLGALLGDAVRQHTSRVALIEDNRRREASRWTYREFDATSRRIARRLQDAGVGPDDRVAILMTNQPAWLLTAAAVFRRGAVLVPLDYKLEPAEQAALLAHCRPKVLVTEPDIARRLPADLPVAHAWDRVLDDLPEGEGDEVPRERTDLATIVYSSGTGGRAKGCLLTHGAYLAQLQGLLGRFPMAPGDRYFSVLPTNHAIDFMVGFVGPFTCGATVVHQRTLRPEMLRYTLQRHGITHMAVVPLLLTALERAVRQAIDELDGWRRPAVEALISVNARLTAKGPRHGLSSRLLEPIHRAFGGQLRLLFCGGAFTDRALAERFYALGIPVVIGYGLTEACTVVTVNGLAPFRADSVGSPLPGTEVVIDAPDASGVGQVLVRGPTLMSGYLDDPELTAETIRDGWLHTGDLGWLDASGHLHLVGRSKDVIVTAGGKNVYPEDIEHAFADVPAEEVAVFATHTLWPQRAMVGETLVAVVRPREALEGLVDELAARNRRLPDFKRLDGVVVWREPFPRTASMKLKRAELARQIAGALARDAIRAL